MSRGLEGKIVLVHMDKAATEHELAASLKAFEGAAWRGLPHQLTAATEAAHRALDAHLEAINAVIVLSKRNAGL